MIGVISDTHDSLRAIKLAVDLFNSAEVELVVHAGDYIAPFTFREFRNLKARFLGVYGNNDGERYGLQKKYSKLGGELSDLLEFQFAGKKFVVYHGTVKPFLDALVESGSYDIVITGHTHKAQVAWRKKVLLLNPGEACGYLGGRKTVCLLDGGSLKAQIVDLE
jgi:hypothetical protein